MKIKNKHYRQFLDEGIIQIITPPNIDKVLTNISHKYLAEAKTLVLTLYLTGARPIEALELTSQDIQKEKTYITIKLIKSKRGVPRTLYLPYKNKYAKQIYQYSTKLPPKMYLFHHFRSTHIRKNKKEEKTAKLRYWFKQWFNITYEEGIPPYYIRHSRISQLAEKGATMEQLRQFKGSKSFDSIYPYIHLSTDLSKKVGRKIE